MILPEYHVTTTNRDGEPLYTTVTSARVPLAPILLLLHGFKGFRNYGFLPWFAQNAAMHGIHVVRVCFSRNGMNNTNWMVMDTEAFASNTISHEVGDVFDTLQALRTHEDYAMLRRSWDGRLFLCGHSRGGGVAQVVANELLRSGDSAFQRVLALNSIGTWKRWTPRQRQLWESSGGMMLSNERTGQHLRMNMSYIRDIEENRDRLSLLSAANTCGQSLHFIHAAGDLTVPITEIETLLRESSSAAELTVIANTTHTFGMQHPVDRITEAFTEAAEKGIQWLLS